MTPDEAMAIVKSKAAGRTRYEGQEPYIDEVLAAEVERLRVRVELLENACTYFMTPADWSCDCDWCVLHRQALSTPEAAQAGKDGSDGNQQV